MSKNSKISYSAPSKIILSGGHSAIHYQPALISALNLRFSFSLWQVVDNQAVKNDENITNVQYASQIVRAYLKEKGIAYQDKNYDYDLDSEIPINQGFAYMDAFSVATIASFYEFYTGEKVDIGSKTKLDIISQLAYQLKEKIDNSDFKLSNFISCYGGLSYYRKEFKFLENTSCLDFDIPKEISDKLYLIHSGDKKETDLEMIKFVQSKIDENPAKYKKIISDIGKTTRAITLGLYENREKLFLDGVLRNQKELVKLGVVPNRTRDFFKELKPFGFGKIIGYGGLSQGSGFSLFVCQQKAKSLEKYLTDRQIIYFKFQQAKEGLLIIDK